MSETYAQRWAITGAAGTIGRALREHLAETSTELVSIDVSEITRVTRSERLLRCDVGDLAALETAFEGCTGVVHLAGIADEADFHDLAEINIVGAYHVLEAARRAEVNRVVYASSNRVTGFYDADTLVDEAMPPRPDGFYGVSKVAGEALCRLYSDKFDLSTVSLRIGSYEPTPGSSREMHTWLSHRDALRAFDAAMTTDQRHAVFYAVSNNAELWWSLESGRAAGFVPIDDAAGLGISQPPFPNGPQGGKYATAEYSVDRMRDQSVREGRNAMTTADDLAGYLADDRVLVLDGALATELERRGCDLNDALWSAKVLLEQPEVIEAVHRDYFAAGANIATTASYQATPAGFAVRGLDEDAALDLISRSVRLAASARAARPETSTPLAVAGAVGPYGAFLSDGSEYRGDYDLTRDEFLEFHRPRAAALVTAGADLLAFETLPKLTEALALADLSDELDVPAWYSFSLRDAGHISDGTALADVARALDARPGVVAIGVNCVPMGLVSPALDELAAHTCLPLVAYPNSGEIYDPLTKTWAPGESTAATLADLAADWRARGARLIGGCCRTTPADITQLADALRG